MACGKHRLPWVFLSQSVIIARITDCRITDCSGHNFIATTRITDCGVAMAAVVAWIRLVYVLAAVVLLFTHPEAHLLPPPRRGRWAAAANPLLLRRERVLPQPATSTTTIAHSRLGTTFLVPNFISCTPNCVFHAKLAGTHLLRQN